MIRDLDDAVVVAIDLDAIPELRENTREGGPWHSQAEVRAVHEAAQVNLLVASNAAGKNEEVEAIPAGLDAMFVQKVCKIGEDFRVETHAREGLSKSCGNLGLS